MLTSMRFMLLWVLGSMTALYATLFVTVLTTVVAGILISIFTILRFEPPFSFEFIALATFVTIGLVMGSVTGSLQKGIMRQRFAASLDGWRIASIIGAVVGTVAAALVIGVPLRTAIETLTLPKREVILMYGALPIVLPLLGLSVAQFVVLARYVHGAWTWILANIVAGLVLFALLMSVITGGVAFVFFALIAVSAAPGIVTGFTLLWLFRFDAPMY